MSETPGLVLHGLLLICQSLLLGGVLCHHVVAPVSHRRLVAAVALVAVFCAVGAVVFHAVSLSIAMDMDIGEALGADFAWQGVGRAALFLSAALLWHRRFFRLALAAVFLAVGVSALGSHAASRLDNRLALTMVDYVHQCAAGIWIGGIPFLLLALTREQDGRARVALARRYSRMAVLAVAALTISALMLAFSYVERGQDFTETDFGLRIMWKAALFIVLMGMGLGNALMVAKLEKPGWLRRLRILALAEAALGALVLFIAASLSSLPPP